MSKKLAVLSFVILFVFAFFRENMLLVINANLAEKQYDWSYYSWFSDLFMDLEKDMLYMFKWIVSILSTLIISVLTVFSLHNWFQNKIYFKLLITIYLFVFGTILVISMLGYLTVGFSSIYPLLRRIFGLIHSPLPFFFFFLLFYKKEKESR